MLKMRRFLFFIALTVVLFSSGGAWYLSHHAQSFLEGSLSRSLQAQVTVGDLTWSLSGLQIQDLSIKNPIQGSPISHAFSSSRVDIRFNLWDVLLGEEVHIKRVHFDQSRIGLDLLNKGGKDNNWVRLLKQAQLGHSEGSSSSDFRVRIDSVLLSRNQLFVRGGPIGKKTKRLSLPDISLRDVGSHESLSTNKVTQLIAEVVTKESMKFLNALPMLGLEVIKTPANLLQVLIGGGKK